MRTQKSIAAKTGLFALRIVLAASIGIACVSAVRADDDSSNLERMETKFFQHTFPKDPMEQRLTRIEKMVFGETRPGSEAERMAKLVESVPAAGASEVPDAPPPSSVASTQRPTQAQKPAPPPVEEIVGGSKYPAVTAMEQKVFGKDFANEPVQQRLARLEQKEFGKPSGSDDLTDRLDALKQRTGIDITKQAANSAGWDDEDESFTPPTAHRTPSEPAYAAPGEDGKSFSGRDLRKDMSKAFNRPTPPDEDVDITTLPGSQRRAPSTWSSAGGTGAYGFGKSSGYPSTAPSFRTAPPADQSLADAALAPRPGGMGLNQQVSALEMEIFGKANVKDPLPARLTRLEETVFPQEKASQGKALPDRVNRLLAVIPISGQSKNRKVANRDLDDLSADGMPATAPQRQGLGKIMNSLGNMLGGGYSGGYPVRGGLVTDPATGLLFDPTTGNLIDPTSGAVIGRRVVQPNYGSAYSPYGSMNSFSNGFSPFGSSPYGTMSPYNSSGIGIGGGGMRFGVGRPMGMWP